MQSLKAQAKLALIKDREGFVSVLQGKGVDAVVIDSIKADEIFYGFDQSNWIKVHRRGTVATGEFDGFVHRNRVEFFDELSDERQRLLFQKIFTERKELAVRASEAYQLSQPLSDQDQKEFDKGLHSNYSLIVQKFSPYFCRTKDRETISIFLETLWADSGSANESPLFEIGACYICEPDLVLEIISRFKSSKKKQYLYQSIEWGIMNLLKEKDPQFVKLKKRLNSALNSK